MAFSNKTLYFLDGEYNYESCMGFTNSLNRSMEVVIPKTWINRGLTEENVKRWVELGNKLIFPATLGENAISTKVLIDSGYDPAFEAAMHVDIEPDKQHEKSFVQPDAACVVHGKPFQFSFDHKAILSFGGSGCNGRFLMYLLKANSDNTYYTIANAPVWNGYLQDFCLIDTKENLADYVKRIANEYKGESSDALDAFFINIHYGHPSVHGKFHRLALTTFYRYLYSPFYDTVVKDTLQLVDLGIDPWIALYAALSRHDRIYRAYYSLLCTSGFKSKANVLEDLRKDRTSVNGAFSANYRSLNNHIYMLWSEDEQELKDNVMCFINGELPASVRGYNRFYNMYHKTQFKDKIYFGKFLSNSILELRMPNGETKIDSATNFNLLP